MVKNAQDNKRFDDREGKALATKFFNYFGCYVRITQEKNNILDGSILTPDGKIVGLEVKKMAVKRYKKHNDILIAPNKYEYANGDGKEISALTETVKFDYVKMADSTIVFVTKFSECDGLETVEGYFQDGDYEDAPKVKCDIYEVPRSKARKYKITDGIIERI